MWSTRATTLGLAAVALFLVAAPAHAGPPWVSIELPANPLNASTRDAFLLVHSYHHGDIAQYPLSGAAIGMVDGKRRTIPLTFERTSLPGVSAVRRTWPAEGRWVLRITLAGDDGPTALVSIADGEVRLVDVPTTKRDGYTMGRKVTDADVDHALRELAAADLPQPAQPASATLALALIPAGLALLILRRR